MILVSVGSQKFQFNRLLKEIDRLIEEKIIEDTVFAQIGVSDYKPKNYEYVDFLTQDKFNKKIDECSLIITHAGTGIIINSLKKGKKVIALPRLVEYGEHVDNHQIQLIKEFENSNLIKAVYEIEDLEKAIRGINEIDLNVYKSNTNNVIREIEQFVKKESSKNLKKVLMLGNSPLVKGGITTVINMFKSHQFDNVSLKFISTYIDKNIFFKFIFFIIAYFKIILNFIFWKPNIVHIHMSYKGSFTRTFFIKKLCKIFKIKIIIHLHGSEFKKWYEQCSKNKQKKIQQLLKEADKLIVLGEQWKKNILDIQPDTNISVLNNAVTIPNEKARFNKNEFKILFLGVLIKRKGIYDLIEAINILKDNNKVKNIKFIIAGTGIEEGNLKNKVKNLKLENYVEFVGWIDSNKKKELLKNSQALILPSYNEGLPMAILEAMSYGLPIIATDVGDVKEAVIDNKNGYIIKKENLNELSNVIIRLTSKTEAEWNKMSLFSVNKVIEKFSDKRFFDEMINIYEEI